MNTPNGQAVQVLLEELKDSYGTEWTTTVIDIMTNEQKKEWFVPPPAQIITSIHRHLVY
jgi:glutathione S-transferase